MVTDDDQRQLPGIGEQNRDEDESEEKIERRKQALPRQKVADRLELAHARHGLAGRSRLEIGDRQPSQMTKQRLAQFDVDAVGRMRQRVGAQILQERRRTSPMIARPPTSTKSVE